MIVTWSQICQPSRLYSAIFRALGDYMVCSLPPRRVRDHCLQTDRRYYDTVSRHDQICGCVVRLIIRQDDRRHRTIRLHHGLVTMSIGVGLSVTVVSHLRARQSMETNATLAARSKRLNRTTPRKYD